MNPNPDRLAEQVITAVRAHAAQRWPAAEQPLIDNYLDHYLATAALEDLLERDIATLYGAAASHFDLGAQRKTGSLALRIGNPDIEQDGWESTHSVIQIICDDKPFLIDSVSMAINELGLVIHLINHPVLVVTRGKDGRIQSVDGDDQGDRAAEAWIHIEVDRQADNGQLKALEQALRSALDDVAVAVEDWQAMRQAARRAGSNLLRHPPAIDPAELDEVSAFIDWMVDDHFTFLGYRRYDLKRNHHEPALQAVADSGLGLLRKERSSSSAAERFAALPPEIKAEALEPDPLILTKSSHRARVHRPGYMDTIGIKRFNANGQVIGEHRFLGLYTSSAYSRNPRDIPLLRRKVDAVLEQAGLRHRSHAGKALVHILETYPRDELFQVDTETLRHTAFGILQLQERQRVRLFLRHDRFGRFVSCLVYAPRERYDTAVRQRMQQILMKALNGAHSEFTVQLSEAVLARIHFIIHLKDFNQPPIDEKALEAELAATTRSWSDQLGTALLEHCGEARGTRLGHTYAQAFNAAYREDTAPRVAAQDIERLEALPQQQGLGISLYRPLEAAPGRLRLKLYHAGEPISLSDVLPVLENMGVRVIDERPYGVHPESRISSWIHDFGLMHDPALKLDASARGKVFQDAFAAIWHGRADDDGFNRLILLAGLDWRDITILRGYAQYLRQAGTAYSQPYIEATLAAHPDIATDLVQLFYARLNPESHNSDQANTLSESIETRLDEVASLDEDRILRRLLAAINATLRTNFFRRDQAGEPRDFLAFKLAPADIPGVPKPVPAFEIFVSSPRVEGVHLRGGKVARGGLRWSDRREDYRTEVLGLMKAQMVKNALIVPVGAKGGFVCKQLPAERADQPAEVLACYRIFIRALLEITDNIIDGQVVPPPQVVRHDDDDPYLVVAADKGTATFSDQANAIAESYGFWLRDAFASGGSSGYDHKKMGITARGAWVAVQRHFRELDRDIQHEPFSVVGIGDMSGDVFGNGMLQSRSLRLIAAFDHRHIFIDPDPDPEASFKERQRLFALERSSWADYNTDHISKGGGVWPRSAKSIRLSAKAREALAISEERLPPNELISAILRAPVDLLWNGGIGTYVKAASESDAEVGDKTNDAVRVHAEDLRCRVIGEGGNLGVTALGRIAFALNGGHINTDAIDNSGGVDCSDHEVNIKILLGQAVDDGDLTGKQRDQLLSRMTDAVAAHVLANNYRQTQAISLMSERAASRLSEQARCLRLLEREGRLDRSVEQLPDDEALIEREQQGLGLTRPELAILLAYTKIRCYEQLLESTQVDQPDYLPRLLDYFPEALRTRFADRIAGHPLRREIIATRLANHVLNRMGATFLLRVNEATGASTPEIVAAYGVARDIYGLGPLWHQIDGLDHQLPAQHQHALLHNVCDLQERATVWLLRHRPGLGDGQTALETLTDNIQQLNTELNALLTPAGQARLDADRQTSVDAGVPEALADQVARLSILYAALDITEAAERCTAPLTTTAHLHFAAAEAVGLDRLDHSIHGFIPSNDWEVRYRSELIDSLHEEQRRLTIAILSGTQGNGVDTGMQQWLETQADRISHLQQMIDQIGAAAKPEPAMLGVALQALRHLGSHAHQEVGQ